MNFNLIVQDAFIDELQKLANTQLEMGKEIEKEHLPTVKKIKASIKDGKITMSNEDIFKSISLDHLRESLVSGKAYYTMLKSNEDVMENLEKKEM